MTSAEANSKDAKEAKDKDNITKKGKVKSLATQSKVRVRANKSPETETSEHSAQQPKKGGTQNEYKKNLLIKNIISVTRTILCLFARSLGNCRPRTEICILRRKWDMTSCLCKGHAADVCRKTLITCVVCHGGHNSFTHTDSERSGALSNCNDKEGVDVIPEKIHRPQVLFLQQQSHAMHIILALMIKD